MRSGASPPEVRDLPALVALNEAADAAIERAMTGHWSLETTIDAMAPVLGEALGADYVLVRTFSEKLVLTDFVWPRGSSADTGALLDRALADGEAFAIDGPNGLFARRIDVAGEDFGVVAMRIPVEGPPERPSPPHALRVWAEELDNYLASIVLSRRKFRIHQTISTALKNPLLHDGINRAIHILHESIQLAEMILMFRHEDDVDGVTLSYKIVKDGKILHDSADPDDAEADRFLRAEALGFIAGDTGRVRERFGVRRCHEEALINGVRTERLVGRIMVTARDCELSTFDRDLLEIFADYVRQRIVDFNHEWKRLSLSFPPPLVRRLLNEPGYVERFLNAQEQDVAIMFTDISGFTKLSERIKSPSAISRLINTWSARVVEIVWETGGVFDKMVGDCVIAMWGPPFFELSPAEACRAAVTAARNIRAYTQTLKQVPELSELTYIDLPTDVATGLNYARTCVGLAGPDENYTGFSSGMNNTARLQGLASAGQILCMEPFVQHLVDTHAFGPVRSAQAKNVSQPLVFRELA